MIIISASKQNGIFKWQFEEAPRIPAKNNRFTLIKNNLNFINFN